MLKLLDSLTESDLEQHRVWAHASNRPGYVRPVSRVPVKNLASKLFSATVKTGAGSQFWALIGQLQTENYVKNDLFKQIHVYNGESWFCLSRYFDFDYQEFGPQALAAFLRVPVSAVFPISYDISTLVVAEPFVSKGEFTAAPEKVLSRAEIIALAIP